MNEIFPALRASRAIAVNHLGYETRGAKQAVLCLGGGPAFIRCTVRETATRRPLFTGEPEEAQAVDGWRGQTYQRFDFSLLDAVGEMVTEAEDPDGQVVTSGPFNIEQRLYAPALMGSLLSYFHSQRCRDRYDAQDRSIPFIGKRGDRVDVHGGWYDASGDVSKYLSHLSYANFMNPQQTPLAVFALTEAAVSPAASQALRAAYAAEAAWGADFLARMFDPSGVFYMTVFDRWTGDPAEREICSYSTQLGHKHDSWQAGFRQGGGMAIAALARMARLGLAGEYTASRYLDVAQAGFAHLQVHNLDYLDDGRENIIDDYCALLAATELCKATGERGYARAANRRVESLIARLSTGNGHTGWFRADDTGERPFAHAAEEGLPLVALVEYLPIADDKQGAGIRSALALGLGHIARITRAVYNPFGYPRQFVKASDGTLKTQFFFPHGNESGYWWQGENARLASLCYAARRAAPYLDHAAKDNALALAQNTLDWILGLNPYHSSMLQGTGRNGAIYGPAKYPGIDGGICNGITSSLSDEDDIAFCETEDPLQSWRWSEQWLPHAAWFALAMTTF